MKLFLVILASVLITVSSSPYPQHPAYGLVRDGNGQIQLVSADAEHDPELSPFFTASTDVFFTLFTNANRAGVTFYLSDNGATLLTSTFNPTKQTRVVIHGWTNNGLAETPVQIKNALLDRDDFNVIIVDWGAGANDWNYNAVVARCPDVAVVTGQMIKQLKDHLGVNPSSVAISGHSLGTHIAGLAGKYLITQGVGKLDQIVGMEPPYLGFNLNYPDTLLTKNDASHVQVIHTGILSFGEALGTADYYPNYGKGQPGCGWDLAGLCAHERSWFFYVESIKASSGVGNKFIARRCANYAAITSKNCVASGANSWMGGEPLDVAASGFYFMNVNAAAPFAKGAAGA